MSRTACYVHGIVLLSLPLLKLAHDTTLRYVKQLLMLAVLLQLLLPLFGACHDRQCNE